MSTLLPGAGHLLVGRRLKGTCCLVVTAALTGGVAWLLLQDRAVLAGWLLTPEVLVGVFLGNLAVLLFRLFATFDAYTHGARPAAAPAMPRRLASQVGVTAALVFLAAVVVLPHAAVGYAVATTHGILHTVFATDEAPPPSSPTTSVDDPATDLTDDATQEPPHNPWLEAGRITVALLGSDGGPGREGDRIDSLLVLTVATESGEAAVFSVDRYLADFPVPDRIGDIYAEECLEGVGWRYLNALYRCGNERAPEAFAAAYPHAEDPAAAAVAEALGEVLGIAVPHHAMVDMAGFVALVDVLGGIEVDLAEPLQVSMSPPVGREWVTVDLPAGQQLLAGEEALAFARIREAEGGDADRMRRQRCLVTSVVDRVDVGAIVRGFPDLATAVEDHVTTSIPLRALPSLIEVVGTVDADDIVAVGFGPPDYRGWDHRPDLPRIQERVRAVLDDPDAVRQHGATADVGGEVCR